MDKRIWKNIGEAAEAKMKRSVMLSRKADINEKRDIASKDELIKRIIGYGESWESISTAIKRLSSIVKLNKNDHMPIIANKRERKIDQNGNNTAPENRHKTPSEVAFDKKRMLELIECADQLLSKGMTFIYEMTFDASVLPL